ncbi:MAG: helix-turn-helix domain-containing protein [Maricaulaceae bacterium]
MTIAKPHNERHIGDILRARREEKGLSVSELANALKMQPKFIAAIENLKISDLPSIGYVLGYVRAYASYVGLNGSDTVARFKIETQVPDNLGRHDSPHFVPKHQMTLPRGIVPALSLVFCAVAVTFLYNTADTSPTAPITLAAAFEESNRTEPAQFASVAADQTTLKAVAPSWVQVRDNKGRVIISRIMVSGETWSTLEGDDITVSARDGGAIELYIGEQRIGKMGQKGVPFSGKSLVLHGQADVQTADLTVMTLANAE